MKTTGWIAAAVFVGLAIAAVWIGVVLVPRPAHASEVGMASWYGPGFHGHKTASGARYDQNAATCAHPKLKFGTVVRVYNLANGKTATCRVNDRGPYSRGRKIDVSRYVAERLGMIHSGVGRVRVEVVK